MNFCVLLKCPTGQDAENHCKWNITLEFAICYHVDVLLGITISGWSVKKKIKENKV
jgi:hypothetical protein